MITNESFVDYVQNKYISGGQVKVIDQNGFWKFYYFNGEIDGDIDIGYLNQDDFELTVLFANHPYHTVSICEGYSEGWLFEDWEFEYEFNWRECDDLTWKERRPIITKYLKDVLTEEDLYRISVSLILGEIQDALGTEYYAEYACKNTLKKLK